MPDPVIIDNALSTDLYTKLLAFVAEVPLKYGSKSNSRTDPHGHFSWKPYHDKRLNLADLAAYEPPLIGAAWKAVMGKLVGLIVPAEACPKLVRCYVNGYPYGSDGYFHRDSDRDGEHTAILYLCPRWDMDWAGETVVSSRLYWAVLPAPNRLLVIPSTDLHCARAVSRKCPEMRTVLVFKFRPQRTPDFEDMSQWLVQHGALRLDHGKDSSLHDHLMRTYWLLYERGLDLGVCRGGALHSIYGTNAFTQALLPTQTDYWRKEVASAWGKEAEEFAYVFSNLNRPSTLDMIAGEPEVFNPDRAGEFAVVEKRWNAMQRITPRMAQALCAIECANLADQGALGKCKNLTAFWQQPRCHGMKSG